MCLCCSIFCFLFQRSELYVSVPTLLCITILQQHFNEIFLVLMFLLLNLNCLKCLIFKMLSLVLDTVTVFLIIPEHTFNQ